MSLTRPDRALRRLVAELATAAPEDITAVVADLDERHRGVVVELLATYLGSSDNLTSSSSAGRGREDLTILDGLSPWLSARLAQDPAFQADRGSGSRSGAGPANVGPGKFTMTPVAIEALAAAATLLNPQAHPIEAPSASRGRSSIGRLREKVRRGRAGA